MNASAPYLTPSQASKRLGVSAKALRLYERRGLIAPLRTEAGWRVYGPDEIARGAEIVALRALGLSLDQTARVLDGDATMLETALAAHQAALEARIQELAGAAGKIRRMRADIAAGHAPGAGEMLRQLDPAAGHRVAFDLPWPWGGERFEWNGYRALNHIVGPLGSGKTRFTLRLAETLPDAAFLGMDRAADGGAAARARLDADPALEARVARTLDWLAGDGATMSPALLVLVAALEAERPAVLVVDMLEHGLDEATQSALIAHLRARPQAARPLFFLTRSTAILDLDAVGAGETILYCPANHAPPMRVEPCRGSAGYEAVATCLATPAVRARTEGVVARRERVG